MSNISLPTNLKWIGFDLDDTLHYYRKASGAALEAVYQYLEDEFGTDIDQLRAAYSGILKGAQSGCFVDGKTSREYRAERFAVLLTRFSIIPERNLEVVLDLYDASLAKHLELKEGVSEVLQAVKAAGLQVMVVSEGPHDAQELTLQRLGLWSFVDLLVTSAQEQRSKTEGLLAAAIQKAGCAAREILYIGDSPESDIVPAQKLGVQCLYVGDAAVAPAGVTQMTSLLELKPVLVQRRSVSA